MCIDTLKNADKLSMSANKNNAESNQLWKVHGLVSKFVILCGLEKSMIDTTQSTACN